MRSLTWHFARFLRQHLPSKYGALNQEVEAVDGEARRLAIRFADDMQDYFRRTLSDSYETLDHLSPEGIVDLYVRENLPDFEADYLAKHLPDFPIAGATLTGAPTRPSPGVGLSACH